MKGKITVTCGTRNERDCVEVQAELKHVNTMDRFEILHAIVSSLEMDATEIAVWAELYCFGVFESIHEYECVYNFSKNCDGTKDTYPFGGCKNED